MKRAIVGVSVGAVVLAVAYGIAVGAPVTDDEVHAGQAIYARCAACHSLTYNRTGPKHCGLFGRRAGSLADFQYSEAMKHSGIVWNEKTLDQFLANPMKRVPGTAMGYAGIPDPKERHALIAYLKWADQSAICKK